MVLKNLDEKIDEILVRRTDRIINELKKEKIIKEETAVLRFIIRKAITDTVRDLDVKKLLRVHYKEKYQF